MTRNVSGVFTDRQHVDSVIGALREASFEAERIGVVGPDGRLMAIESHTEDRQGIGSWLMGHLLQREHPHAAPERYQGRIPEGRWMVTVAVQTDVEDRDARTLIVSAGAEEISSAADGALVAVR